MLMRQCTLTALLSTCVVSSSNPSPIQLGDLCRSIHDSISGPSRTAFKKFMFRMHPDKNGNPDVTELFKFAQNYRAYIENPFNIKTRNLFTPATQEIIRHRLRADCMYWPNPQEEYFKLEGIEPSVDFFTRERPLQKSSSELVQRISSQPHSQHSGTEVSKAI